MREILFRGIRVDNAEWVEGNYVHINDEHMISINYRNHNELNNPHLEWVDIDRETVGQFTGLCDKNGKRIFEGDIVKGQIVSAWTKKEISCKVEYVKDRFVSIERCRDRLVEHKLMFAKPILVIGNIHDNPELLEENE